MKVSLNIVRRLNEKYDSADDVTAIGIDELVRKVGAQLGGVDEVIDLGKKYRGIVIAKVVSCVKHPDADKLNLCKIDDGRAVKDVERDGQGYVQVVCGAPNVREGLTVAWLPPGTTVPETFDKEPFVLEAREIRGQKSNGMLASLRELALGDSHAGILELGEAQPGADFAETLGLDDTILDIENKMFTHRPDCFGFLGIAREFAGIQGLPYASPGWYVPRPAFPETADSKLPLEIRNELPDLVRRFTAVTMAGVKVGPSPLWLQVALAELGQKSINNIVDYTNFYMLETGQPLHAYDYDKVKSLSGGEAVITIRNPKPGEKIKLLNGKQIEPRAEAIMIATDKQLIGVGGVMGGSETEVDEHTENIILECANFDMYSVRRTSMAHGLFTDAVTRFTKGQSPLQNLAVLAKIVDEIHNHAAGQVAGQVLDDNHLDATVLERNSLYPPVKLAADFINDRLGLELAAGEMKTLLENVEFKVELNGGELIVAAPFWRTDIELREDVVEEIGRLYGYDKLPLELPRRDLAPVAKDPLLELKAAVRRTLSRAGANEVLTYSFVHGDLMDKVGQDKAVAFQVANALSPDLQYYRLSLLPSLLDKIHLNVKAGYDRFGLFELGKAHIAGVEHDGVPVEFERAAFVFAADAKAAKQYGGAPYYQAKKFLVELLAAPGLADDVVFETLDPAKYIGETRTRIPYYETGRAATVHIGDTVLGEVGEFKLSVRQALKLPDYAAGFEIDLLQLLKPHPAAAYVPLPRFPKVTQDLTLKVPAELAYRELLDFVRSEIAKAQPPNSLPKLEFLDIYQAEDDAGHKNVSFRLSIASYDRTLTDAEVNRLLDTAAAAAETEFSAKRA